MKNKFLLAIAALLSVGSSYAQNRALSMNWSKIGPSNGVGTATAIVVDNADSKKLFLGNASGGLFVSDDNGTSWSRKVIAGMSPYISSMTQTSDGTLYVGTGYVNDTVPSTELNFSAQGNGIWYSTDHGVTFTQFANCTPAAGDLNDTWSAVKKIEAVGSYIYAATRKGLYRTSDKGTTWELLSGLSSLQKPVYDFLVNGNTILVSFVRGVYASVDGGVTFTSVTGNGSTQITETYLTQNANSTKGDLYSGKFLYLNGTYYFAGVKSNGYLAKVFYSTDGLSWGVKISGGSQLFEPFNGKVLTQFVFSSIPGENDKMVISGNNYYTYSPSEGWIKRLSNVKQTSIAFDPANAQNVYLGFAGNVYRIKVGAYSFDNGMLSPTGYTPIATGIIGSDVNKISAGYKSLYFSTYANGTFLIQEPDQYGSKAAISINPAANTTNLFASFHAQADILETGFYGGYRMSNSYGESYLEGKDALGWYTGKLFDAYKGGTDITYSSKATPFDVSENRAAGKHKMALGLNCDMNGVTTINTNSSVWVTSNGSGYANKPNWYRVAGNELKPSKLEGYPEVVKFAANQNELYVATYSATSSTSLLFRISGLSSSADSILTDLDSDSSLVTVTKIANFGSRRIAAIATDPSVSGHVVITFAKGGAFTDYIYETYSADTAGVTNDQSLFVSVQSNLSEIVINDLIIDHTNPANAFVATNNGLYYSENFNAGGSNVSWTLDNTFPIAIVSDIEQINQDASAIGYGLDGRVYAAAVGSGIYMSNALVGVKELKSKATNVVVYPNPNNGAFTVKSDKAIKSISVKNLMGQVVYQNTINTGSNSAKVDVALSAGVYLVEIVNETGVAETIKFAVK